MNQVKQSSKKLRHQINIDYIKQIISISNKISSSITINSIENFSNEFFYEIFDYLNGCEIYKAFSNLNHRFQQLLNSSSLLFKIKLDHLTLEEIFINNYRHKIFSFHISLTLHIKQSFSSFTFDSSFNRLESLTVEQIKSDMLISLLINLARLPRLFSLTIKSLTTFKNVNNVYRLIFALPMLKYNQLWLSNGDTSITLPMATNNQLSTIKYLVIDHSCTFSELACLVSYTPQLSHVNLMRTDYTDSNIRIIFPITLSNLIHLSIYANDVEFNEFEIFISKIYSKLQVLKFINSCDDISYLDANRWEKLISKYLLQLKQFYFSYCQYIGDEYNSPKYLGESNQFISTFWIQKKWIFEVEIHDEDIIYSIQSYNKRWYEYPQHPSSFQLSKSARLTLTYYPRDKCSELVILDINSILNITQIYHLEISEDKIFLGRLVDILSLLPELISLRINCLSIYEPRFLCQEEIDRFISISITNKIKQICFEKINKIGEIYFLIELCYNMNYLQVNCINDINVELFVRNILFEIMNQSDYQLRSMCFSVPIADDEMVKQLEEMINVENLLLDFTIKRVMDKIYLQWK